MIRRLMPLAVVLLLTLVLAIAVQDFVRDVIVVPVVYAAWIIWLSLVNLPDWVLWSVLVLFTAVLAVRSIRGRPSPPRGVKPGSDTVQGAVTLWTQRLQNANSRQSSRWRIARDLGHVYWETHFPEEPFNMQTFLARIDQPELTMPSVIRDYFQAGLSRPEPAYRTWFKLRRNRSATPLDLDPAIVVAFLEESQEITHE